LSYLSTSYLLLLLLLQLYVRQLAFLGRNRFLLFVSYYLLILLLWYIFFFHLAARDSRACESVITIYYCYYTYYYNYYYDCRYRCCSCREDEETTMRVARGPAYAIWLQREGKGSFGGRERRADPRVVAPGKRTDTPQAAVIVRCPLALSVPFW